MKYLLDGKLKKIHEMYLTCVNKIDQDKFQLLSVIRKLGEVVGPRPEILCLLLVL